MASVQAALQSDKRWLQTMLEVFNLPRVALAISDSPKRWPDIWVSTSPQGYPVITVTREWARQRVHERRKRLLHELLHLKGKRHGMRRDGLVYSTYPEKDSYSKALYQSLRNPPRQPWQMTRAEAAAPLAAKKPWQIRLEQAERAKQAAQEKRAEAVALAKQPKKELAEWWAVEEESIRLAESAQRLKADFLSTDGWRIPRSRYHAMRAREAISVEEAQQAYRRAAPSERLFLRWDTVDYQPGDVFPPSRKWVDGDPMPFTYKGTSALDPATNFSRNGLEGQYKGDLYLVRGKVMRRGQDEGEVLLQRAEVVKKLDTAEAFGHRAVVQQALAKGKLTPEQADALGHFKTYPDLAAQAREKGRMRLRNPFLGYALQGAGLGIGFATADLFPKRLLRRSK